MAAYESPKLLVAVRVRAGMPNNDLCPRGQIGKVISLKRRSSLGSNPSEGTNNASVAQRKSTVLIRLGSTFRNCPGVPKLCTRGRAV